MIKPGFTDPTLEGTASSGRPSLIFNTLYGFPIVLKDF